MSEAQNDDYQGKDIGVTRETSRAFARVGETGDDFELVRREITPDGTEITPDVERLVVNITNGETTTRVEVNNLELTEKEVHLDGAAKVDYGDEEVPWKMRIGRRLRRHSPDNSDEENHEAGLPIDHLSGRTKAVVAGAGLLAMSAAITSGYIIYRVKNHS